MQPLNVLYINSHDTGRYVQPYGHAVPTPNIQKFAEEGILFRQAFCAGPTCSPSRASLLTGQCAHSSGMLGLRHRGWALNDDTQHLAHFLGSNGYNTALMGFQHESKSAYSIGYKEAVTRAPANEITDAAVGFLDKAPQQPFFMSLGFVETHRDFNQATAAEDPRYTLPPIPLPDTAETRKDMADFKASARALDDGIGKILKSLEKNNLADKTLVICTTDHGIAFPYMKCNLTDHGIGVMLMMRGPGGFSGGKVIDSLISQIDIFPTLCELLGIKPPAYLQGKSFMPLISGEKQEINDEIFSEVTYHASYEPQRAVRTKRWKYIKRFYDVIPNANCDGGFSKDLLLKNGWGEKPGARDQLYDLLFDPQERNNLAQDPAHSQVLKEMKTRLGTWMKKTDDPLLRGHVFAPEDARVNPVTTIEPKDPPVPGKQWNEILKSIKF